MKNLLLIGFVVSLALAGCGGESPEGQLASAKEYLRKKDSKAAAIQIKNVLQKQPDSGEARFLLGTTLLQQGNVAGAEVELRKALVAQYSKDEVVPELARAMLLLGQAKKMVDEFSGMQLSKPSAQASLQTSLASAYAALGQGSASQAALSAALAADKTYVPAQLLDASRKAAARDFDGALATIETVLQIDANSPEAWTLKGDLLLYGKADGDAALNAYRQAVAAAPDSLSAQFALVAQLIRKGDLEEAGRQLEQMKKLAPKHPTTRFVEATLALQQKDFRKARDLAQQLVQTTPRDPKVLQLAGAAELQGGSPAQAEIYLTRATQIAPGLAMARRLLIVSYLRTGQPAKALAALNALDEKSDFDAGMYALAGEVYLQNGDAKRAEKAFAQSLKLDPADARKRTALAVTQLASGRADAGLGELQGIAGTDSGVTADLALISAHLRRQEFDKALAAVDRLEKKQPDKPLAANLRGRIQMLQKDIPAARKSFERALAIDPGFFPAVASLATLDVADKRPEDAKKRFEAVLSKDPRSVQALLALAQLAAANPAGRDEALNWLKRAAEAAPTNPTPRLLLIDAYLRLGDSKQALVVAQSAVTAIPDNPDLLMALGRVQQVSGEINQALITYGKAVAAQPLSPAPLVRLAEAQTVARDLKAAEQSLRKALELKPDLLDAQRGLIMLQLNDKNHKDALAIARLVQQQRPKEIIGLVMEAEIEQSRKGWPAAIDAYKRALQIAPAASSVATKLHSAFQLAGNTKEAEQFSQTWLSAHPKDAVFIAYLGDEAIAAQDYPLARKRLQRVLQLQPDNPIALNNLAWVNLQLKLTDDALQAAERANALAPNQPPFMDTWAVILSAKSEHGKAIELQNKVVALQPDNHVFRLNLAKIYLAAGDKIKAKTELDSLTKLGDKFRGQAEVAAMLKTL